MSDEAPKRPRFKAAGPYVAFPSGLLDSREASQVPDDALLMYIAMWFRSRQSNTDGILTEPQMRRLGFTKWQAKAAQLQQAGLITIDRGDHRITDYLKYNPASLYWEQFHMWGLEMSQRRHNSKPQSQPEEAPF